MGSIDFFRACNIRAKQICEVLGHPSLAGLPCRPLSVGRMSHRTPTNSGTVGAFPRSIARYVGVGGEAAESSGPEEGEGTMRLVATSPSRGWIDSYTMPGDSSNAILYLVSRGVCKFLFIINVCTTDLAGELGGCPSTVTQNYLRPVTTTSCDGVYNIQ